MYIKITDRCNMTCAHCCVSATAEGKDMSMRVFRAAIALAENRGSYVSIGGGEPTVHPRFWQMLGHALGSDVEGLWLATNGKRAHDALALAGIARNNERFSVSLSQDPWHDEIEQRVVDAFKRAKLELRDVSQSVIDVGRARDTGIGWLKRCSCPGLYVCVNGDIRPCDCKDAPIVGNVFDGIDPRFQSALDSDEYLDTYCWTKFKERFAENEGEGALAQYQDIAVTPGLVPA